LPAREFGANVRARAASSDIAQRALTGDPVAGQLPISPHDRPRALAPGGAGRVGGASTGRAGNSDSRGGLVIARPAPPGPARAVPDRPTGAAARTPGVALDNDLRRTRIFGGRSPRAGSSPASTGGVTQGEADTGAVTRPSRPSRRPADDGRGGSVGGGAIDPRGASAQPNADRAPRPARDGSVNDSDKQPRARPSRPSWQARPPVERPAAPVSQPESRPRPSAPVERPQTPPRREESPAPRPAPSEARPRSEPRQEAPRSEPRQAPPRQEAPRQEAPRQERSAPAQRQERPAAPARPAARPRAQEKDQR
jgi:hypothetical protein